MFPMLWVLPMLFAPAAALEAPRRMQAQFAAQAPRLEGRLTEWQQATPIAFSGRPLAGHPRHATVYALWDAANLYLAFDVYSSPLQAQVREHDGDRLWFDDGIEFLIDAHRDRGTAYLPDDFAYHINIRNTVFDDRGTPQGQPDKAWNGVARHSVHILSDHRYLVEVAVPWAEIGLTPVAGTTRLGIDLCVNGSDPATGAYDYFDWCHLQVFHDPSGFGEMELVG